jgi:hypothetical protein
MILRLDPNHVFDYISNSEEDSDNPTIFKIKPLTIREFNICRQPLLGDGFDDKKNSYAVYHLEVLKFGLIGWENFYWDDTDEVIPFAVGNINAIIPDVRDELTDAILKISEVNYKIESKIRLACKWSEYLSKQDKPEQWSCMYCQKNTATRSARNCEGNALRRCRSCSKEVKEPKCPTCGKVTTPKFMLRLNKKIKDSEEGLDYVTRCPIALMDPKVLSVMNIINLSDELKTPPVDGSILEQSSFYYQVRQIILEERNAALSESRTSYNAQPGGAHQGPATGPSPQALGRLQGKVKHVNFGGGRRR